MSLISQLFFAIIITSFTGTVAHVIWKPLREFFKERNPDLVYLTLRLVCLLYVLPAGFLILQLTAEDGYLQTDGLWQLNFNVTGIMKFMYLALAVIWLVLTVRCSGAYIKQSMEWRDIFRGNIPEDDEVAEEEFKRIKKKLRIHRRIRLYRNDMLASPMITGILFCKVILPYRHFNREQLRVIFYHELTHYKNHDMFYKLCSVYVIGAIQHLNAFSEDLLEQLNEWSEYYCDVKAIDAMKGEIAAGRYFETIIGIMENVPGEQEEDYIFSMLCESEPRLERRIDYMRKYAKRKATAKGVTFLTAFVFAMASVTTAYAAGGELAGVHDFVYKNTEQVANEAEITDLEELFIPAAEDNDYSGLVYAYPELEYIMPLLDENEMAESSWSISPGVRHVSNKIKLEAGQVMSISCSVIPATVPYWMGIMNTDGDVRYVSGTTSIAHDFVINEGDSYRVLVQNAGKIDITASITYFYYTPEESTETQ